MALAKNDVYARIELEQVTVQNVIHFLLLFNCVADTASLFLFLFLRILICITEKLQFLCF
jgi:hypothetical protein